MNRLFLDVDNFWTVDTDPMIFRWECLGAEKKEIPDCFDKRLRTPVTNAPADFAQY